MFKKIFIKRNGVDDKQIDIGKISECLLFYKSTDVLIDKFVIEQLCSQIDIGLLKEYSDESMLNIFIRKNAIGIGHVDTNIGRTYCPMITSSESFNLSELLYSIYFKITGKKAIAKKNRRDFLEICNDFKYSNNLSDKLIEEWKDSELLTKSVRTYLNSYLPQLDLTNLKCEVVDKIKYQNKIDTYKVVCNQDLEELSNQYKDLLPKDFKFSILDVLLRMSETSGDLDIAGNKEAEIYTDVRNEIYIQTRFEELFKKIIKSENEIKVFQEYVLDDYKPIGNTLQIGERSFSEFAKIIEKAKKFKSWLEKVDSDQKLISEYYKEVTKGTWIDKKPAKIGRYVIFTGAGIIGNLLAQGIPVGSLASAATDKFLVDKLFNKWKPNHFIDGEVKPFLPLKDQ